MTELCYQNTGESEQSENQDQRQPLQCQQPQYSSLECWWRRPLGYTVPGAQKNKNNNDNKRKRNNNNCNYHHYTNYIVQLLITV